MIYIIVGQQVTIKKWNSLLIIYEIVGTACISQTVSISLVFVFVGDMTLELHYLGLSHGAGMTTFVLPQQKIGYIADLSTPKQV